LLLGIRLLTDNGYYMLPDAASQVAQPAA